MERQLGRQQRLHIGAPNNNPAQIPPVEMQTELYFHLLHTLVVTAALQEQLALFLLMRLITSSRSHRRLPRGT